jgi:hypothetical protein
MVEVISTEVCTDKNGRDYRRVTLGKIAASETWTNPNTGEIMPLLSPGRTVRTIGYKVPYLYDEDDSSAVPDYLWNATPGMVLEGQILRREVVPYEINGDTRNYHTCFVQGNSNSADFEMAVKEAFDRSGRTLLANAVRVPINGDMTYSNPGANEAVATARGIVANL